VNESIPDNREAISRKKTGEELYTYILSSGFHETKDGQTIYFMSGERREETRS
jgi:hypothetical protein